MATLRLEHVSKRYGQVEAVRDLSLDASDGELIALLGPSGCGKTSTLKMVAGLEDITEGAIYFDDRRVNEVRPEERNVAMVFEDYSLYPRMSVYDNVAFPLRVRRFNERDVEKRVMRLLETLELAELRKSGVLDLSGGQQQRIAIARALVREPALLIFDEPLSHLDAELKGRLRAEMRWLQQERGVTSVLVTHDQAEAMAMADRIAVMNLGVLHQFATPHEIYRSPADLFVADFIGEPPMNVLEAEVEHREDGVVLRAPGLELDLGTRGPPMQSLLGDRERVKIGIRPEHARLDGATNGGGFAADVFFKEWLGDYQVVLLSEPDLQDHWFTLLTPPEVSVRIGERVRFVVDVSGVNLFDVETGKNIVAARQTDSANGSGRAG
jgi:ABC-type sugar transport system ATPase subunit